MLSRDKFEERDSCIPYAVSSNDKSVARQFLDELEESIKGGQFGENIAQMTMKRTNPEPLMELLYQYNLQFDKRRPGYCEALERIKVRQR